MTLTSRDTEHKFISTDTDEIVGILVGMYEKMSGAVVRPASPEMMLCRWCANIIVQERALNNYTANQNIPSRASGENLDALAELTHIQERPQAKPSVCKMRFEISEPQESAVLIPVGTRIADKEKLLYWQTLTDVYVPIGEIAVETKAECMTSGVAGNGYAVGQITALVDIYDYYYKCTNITATEGGSDEATDEEFYKLMRVSMDAFSCAGAQGAYIYFAKKVSPKIADVVPVSPTPGVVKLYVLMDDGTLAGESLKQEVLDACSEYEVRPMTDFVSVEDAELVEYDINFTYYLQNGKRKSAAQIETDVKAAVDRYVAWQAGKLGRDINPDELREYLYHTGIKRVAITAPEFTHLRDGRDRTVPQVARVSKITVTSGGYEDE